MSKVLHIRRILTTPQFWWMYGLFALLGMGLLTLHVFVHPFPRPLLGILALLYLSLGIGVELLRRFSPEATSPGRLLSVQAMFLCTAAANICIYLFPHTIIFQGIPLLFCAFLFPIHLFFLKSTSLLQGSEIPQQKNKVQPWWQQSFALLGLFFIGELLFFAATSSWVQFFLQMLLLGAFSMVLPVSYFVTERKASQEQQKLWHIHVQALYDQAQRQRLISQPPKNDNPLEALQAEEVKQLQGSLLVLEQTQQAALQLLKKALHAHACILLWWDEKQQIFYPRQALLAKPELLQEAVFKDTGLLGALCKNKALLQTLAPKIEHLSYYQPNSLHTPIAAFLGVPLLTETNDVCGLLCIDRAEANAGNPAFSQKEEALAKQAAAWLVSSLQSEQLFVRAERSRVAQERLYQASQQLNRAITTQDVYRIAFQSLFSMGTFDFIAIVLHEETTNTHQIVALEGEELLQKNPPAEKIGYSFLQNTGLVSMTIKNKIALPQVDMVYQPDIPLFDDTLRLKQIQSVLVLPLLCGSGPIGTLVLGSKLPKAFDKAQRDLLGVVANQVAIALENAQRYQAMEAMATTDGLTQLLNRRTWNDRFADMLARAERYKHPLAILLTDVDFFKKVNDVHGHLSGDAVLKRVAQIIQSCLRKVDLAARYGGEEFVVVLDGADAQTGWQLAERIRQEVQKQEFRSEKGTFHCTLSLGLAMYPKEGTTAEELTDRADKALYHAKRTGRDRTVIYADMPAVAKAASDTSA